MLTYCMVLTQDIIENKGEVITYPTIIPIVLYTGKGNWNIADNYSKMQQFSKEQYEEYKIENKYKVVDVNLYSVEELLEKQMYLATLMIMEKCKDKEERKMIE